MPDDGIKDHSCVRHSLTYVRKPASSIGNPCRRAYLGHITLTSELCKPATMPHPQLVSFRQMRDATAEDYAIIAANDELTARELPDRLLAQLRLLDEDDGAYQISRLRHVLQCATRAERDGADDDWIVAALVHDVGDVLAPYSHAEVAAEILRPFVRDEVTWVVRHHGTFQRYYNVSLSQEQRNARERFRDHPHYQTAVDFCENWDQCSFDPDYDTHDLEHFEPVLRRVFGRKPFAQSEA